LANRFPASSPRNGGKDEFIGTKTSPRFRNASRDGVVTYLPVFSEESNLRLMRWNSLVKDRLNEAVYQQDFEKVFEDTERRHSNLTIYRVPAK